RSRAYGSGRSWIPPDGAGGGWPVSGLRLHSSRVVTRHRPRAVRGNDIGHPAERADRVGVIGSDFRFGVAGFWSSKTKSARRYTALEIKDRSAQFGGARASRPTWGQWLTSARRRKMPLPNRAAHHRRHRSRCAGGPPLFGRLSRQSRARRSAPQRAASEPARGSLKRSHLAAPIGPYGRWGTCYERGGGRAVQR